jgi:hypothetical protein
MSTVPWWALLSSGAAPVLLVGGWLAASALQPTGYDQFTQTISSLYADGATDRWLMTMVVALLGVSYITTAFGLNAVRSAGRGALVLGGGCSILLAFSPQPTVGMSLPHIVATGMGFTAMAIWPLLAAGRGPSVPWPLRPASSTVFTVAVLASTAWFLTELQIHGEAGLAERVVTGLQAVWPAIVAFSLRLSHDVGRIVDDQAAGARLHRRFGTR